MCILSDRFIRIQFFFSSLVRYRPLINYKLDDIYQYHLIQCMHFIRW